MRRAGRREIGRTLRFRPVEGGHDSAPFVGERAVGARWSVASRRPETDEIVASGAVVVQYPGRESAGRR